MSVKPLEEGNENEIFNEAVIYLVCVLMMNFLNIAAPVDFRDKLGWVVIVIGGGNIMINMGLTVKQSLLDMIATRHRDKVIEDVKIKFEYTMKKRKNALKKYPEQLKELQEEMDLIEAVNYCRDWNPHRRWLLKNDVNIHDYPEEIKFQDYVAQHKMYEKAYAQRLKNALNFVAKEKTFQLSSSQRLMNKHRTIKMNQLLALEKLNISQRTSEVSNTSPKMINFKKEMTKRDEYTAPKTIMPKVADSLRKIQMIAQQSQRFGGLRHITEENNDNYLEESKETN